MSSTSNADRSYSIESERHVFGVGALENIDTGTEEAELEEYLERILADVETPGESQNYDFEVWTAEGSHASVSYRKENGTMYVKAAGGETAVETVLYDAETDGYMEELEDIWF